MSRSVAELKETASFNENQEAVQTSKHSIGEEEIITDGSRKKGRLTLNIETTNVLKGLAVERIQAVEKLKSADEEVHRGIINLSNVAGSLSYYSSFSNVYFTTTSLP